MTHFSKKNCVVCQNLRKGMKIENYMENNKNGVRSRSFACILYTDDSLFDFRFEKIKKMDTVYILHDKDVTILDNGEIEEKKPHYHVLFYFKNPIWLNSLSEKLDLPLNYIEVVNSFNNYAAYLVHLHDKDKYQYSFDELQGNLKNKVLKIITKNDTPTSIQVSNIIDYIYTEDNLTYKKVVDYAILNGYHDYLVGRWYFFKSIIDEKILKN